ncbi:hypothetical protein, partial [Serratia marcescens]|uniref:hypothetical protein n=1 Tax=Serratia marcescens TaxID=615 RepID=UPI0028138720
MEQAEVPKSKRSRRKKTAVQTVFNEEVHSATSAGPSAIPKAILSAEVPTVTREAEQTTVAQESEVQVMDTRNEERQPSPTSKQIENVLNELNEEQEQTKKGDQTE